jgi:MFS-type transporter involved in bile tolerance (Atg22 family)
MVQLFFLVGYFFITITFPVLYHHLHTKYKIIYIAIIIYWIICLGYLLLGMSRVHEYPVEFVQTGPANRR